MKQPNRIILALVAAASLAACSSSKPSDSDIREMLSPRIAESANARLVFLDMNAADDFFSVKSVDVVNGVSSENNYKAFVKASVVFNYDIEDLPKNKRPFYARTFGDFSKGQPYQQHERDYNFVRGDKGWMLRE